MEDGTGEPKHLLTTGQVAEMFGVKRQAVNKWVKKGQIAAVRTPGGHIRILRTDAEAFLEVEPAAS